MAKKPAGTNFNAAHFEVGSTSSGVGAAGNIPPFPSIGNHSTTDHMVAVCLRSNTTKAKIFDLATKSADELVRMATLGEPLWSFDFNKGCEVLNEDQYSSMFGLDATLAEIILDILTDGPMFKSTTPDPNSQDGAAGRLPLLTEASRAMGTIYKQAPQLVQMFMNAVEWPVLFSNLISKSAVLGVLLTADITNQEGTLQVMRAEFVLPTPFLPTRECYFARYCRQLNYNTWVVCDVSLESVIPNPLSRFQRKPSGCLVRATEEGFSKVSWVEHWNIDYNGYPPTMFNELMQSGFAFCAKRWTTTLERQFDNLSVAIKEMMSPGGGRSSLLRLAHRMGSNFASMMNSTTDNCWKPIGVEGEDDIRVRVTFNCNTPGRPNGVAVTVATSFRLPVDALELFDFLRHGSFRKEWDLLSAGRDTSDILFIPTSRHPACSVAVVAVEPALYKPGIMYLQDTYTDGLGHYVVYAPIDIPTMHMVLEGRGNPDLVAILASGFSILPDGVIGGGSILTVGVQVMDEKMSPFAQTLPPTTVATLHNIIANITSLIRSRMIKTPPPENDDDDFDYDDIFDIDDDENDDGNDGTW